MQPNPRSRVVNLCSFLAVLLLVFSTINTLPRTAQASSGFSPPADPAKTNPIHVVIPITAITLAQVWNSMKARSCALLIRQRACRKCRDNESRCGITTNMR